MFRLQTAVVTFALVVGLGATSQAQMFVPGASNFGVGAFQGGLYTGFGGGIGAGVGGVGVMIQPTLPYGNYGFYNYGGYGLGYGYGYGAPGYYGGPYYYGGAYSSPYYPAYPYVVPQTYNMMGSLMNSIESSTSSRDGWRRRPW